LRKIVAYLTATLKPSTLPASTIDRRSGMFGETAKEHDGCAVVAGITKQIPSQVKQYHRLDLPLASSLCPPSSLLLSLSTLQNIQGQCQGHLSMPRACVGTSTPSNIYSSKEPVILCVIRSDAEDEPFVRALAAGNVERTGHVDRSLNRGKKGVIGVPAPGRRPTII